MFVIQFTFCHVYLFPEFSQNDIFSPQFTHNYNTATTNQLIRKQLNIILTVVTSTRIVLRAVRADLIVNERKLRSGIIPVVSGPPMTLITSVSILFCAQTHDHHDRAPGDQNDTIQSPDCQNMTDIRDCENIAVYTHKQRRDTLRST